MRAASNNGFPSNSSPHLARLTTRERSGEISCEDRNFSMLPDCQHENGRERAREKFGSLGNGLPKNGCGEPTDCQPAGRKFLVAITTKLEQRRHRRRRRRHRECWRLARRAKAESLLDKILSSEI